VEKGRGNHTRRFDVPLELEKLTFLLVSLSLRLRGYATN
jgi:hypothetical protein